eukprot:362400-Chlamydomonas_euryale.AAC.1
MSTSRRACWGPAARVEISHCARTLVSRLITRPSGVVWKNDIGAASRLASRRACKRAAARSVSRALSTMLPACASSCTPEMTAYQPR